MTPSSSHTSETLQPIAAMNIDQSQPRPDDISSENAAVLKLLEQQQIEGIQKNIADGLLVRESDLCRRLGWTVAALNAALNRNEIFAVCDRSGTPFYPAFFCEAKKSLQTMLAQVCMALGDLPGTSKWYFFNVPRYSLRGIAPLEVLAKGHAEAVLNAAAAYVDGY